MKILLGLEKIKRVPAAVVALGVFDGVHRGHRKILKEAVNKAHRIGGRSVVFTFWPHPQGKASLYSLKHRLKLIEETGIDICIVARFNKRFSLIAPEDFVKNILVGRIKVRYIYVGKNFRFGRKAKGSFRLLKKLSFKYGFVLKGFDVIKAKGIPISSTYIRRAISRGEFSSAEKMLLKPVSILGTVIRGRSLGARLGFNTANINPHHEALPAYGVYAVRVILDKNKFNGVCYIGSNPTLKLKIQNPKLKKQRHIETHIFNFRQNIYGRDLEVQFIRKMRNEKTFLSLALLAQQVKKDLISARNIFSHRLHHHNSCLTG